MATPTTTWAAIANQMALTIEALTPTVRSDVVYRQTDTEMASFQDWAERTPDASFRKFDIVPQGTPILPIEDFQSQMRETQCEIVIAYPHMWGEYATAGYQSDSTRQKNYRGMVAVMEVDANAIMQAVGRRGSANYVSGQRAAVEEAWNIEDRTGVSFVVIPMLTTYHYDAS